MLTSDRLIEFDRRQKNILTVLEGRQLFVADSAGYSTTMTMAFMVAINKRTKSYITKRDVQRIAAHTKRILLTPHKRRIEDFIDTNRFYGTMGKTHVIIDAELTREIIREGLYNRDKESKVKV